MKNKIGRLDSIENGGGSVIGSSNRLDMRGRTPEPVNVRICYYKEVVESILTPTGTICEDCSGYDTKCPGYSVRGNEK